MERVSPPQRSALDLVEALVDKSLLRQVEMPNGAVRLLMLETIREYALAQLEASGEAEQLRRRHATYFLALSEEGWRGRHDWEGMYEAWLLRTNSEYDNMVAALGWFQSPAGEPELALRLTITLTGLWCHRNNKQRAVLELVRVLARPPESAPVSAVMDAHGIVATAYAGLGNYRAARAHDEQFLPLARALGDRKEQLWALEHLGWLAREQGDSRTAWEWFAECLALARELNNTRWAAQLLLTMAEVAVVDEDAARAEELLAASAEAWSDTHSEPEHVAWTLNHRGHAAQLRGDYAQAVQLHRNSLTYFPGHFEAGILEAYHALGEAKLGLGQANEATSWLVQALALSQAIDAPPRIAWCLASLGSAAALDGEPERAARLWSAAEQLRQSCGSRPAPATRATYERAMAQAHAQLSEEAFAAAWAKGRAMTPEQAIAYALEGSEVDSASSTATTALH
jgi:tetratricopeptide (TPR) repeat protein